MEYIILAIVIGVLGYLYFFLGKKWSLRPWVKEKYRKELERAVMLDPEHGIIVVDRVLEQILSALHGKRSLGENLKKYYSSHPERNEIWRYHKIRNELVHEWSVPVTGRDIQGFWSLIQRVFL